MIAYWNNTYLPAEEITLSAFDLGVLRGYGVFDVMRTESGKPYNIEKHWARFVNSAQRLNLTIPVTQSEFTEILTHLVTRNVTPAIPDVNLRVVLTGGVSTDAFSPEPGKETFFVLVTPFVRLAKEMYEEGGKLITLEYQRDIPEAKITNYVTAIQNSKLKKEAGAVEILFTKNGLVTEASTSNFFAVINGTLVTAKEGVLLGTTRNLLITLAKENGIPVEERDVTLEEVLSADEAFITAVNKFVVPIVTIDTHIIGSGEPGDLTQKMSKLLEESIENSLSV